IFSKAASRYYIHAANAGINDIASQLVEQLSRVIQVYCLDFTSKTLVIIRCNRVQLLNLLPSRYMRPYPSVDELNKLTAQENDAI
ncbi:MAG: hypothetical protein EZS28_040380, partial [Streblomastix strix]